MTTSPEPEATPTKRAARSSLLTLVVISALPVIVALFVTVWASPYWLLQWRNVSLSTNVTTQSPADDVLLDKYASDLVKIAYHPLLVSAAGEEVQCPDFQPVDEELTHVELALDREEQLRDQDRTAALGLGADPDRVANGLKLFSIDGLPIMTTEELHLHRIAHVLLDGQLWVWPGVKVAYVREVDGCTVTTRSLHPKVFTVEGFFSQEEADAIIAEGVDHLSRSPVDSSETEDGYHADRTSYTAFLDDSHFTRDFRVRSSRLARLPSPSYTENMQLVRYETGQFYRNHEDYFESKEFVPNIALSANQFEAWIEWASSKIEELCRKHGDNIVPAVFQPGVLRNSQAAFDLVVKSWVKRAGDLFTYEKPKYLYHFEPNRFVTLFLYLNDCPEGGETIFPYSNERLVTGIEREGMDECSDGLAVPPVKLTASLFYAQTPMNGLDPSSLHGGCPPAKGIKFGANSFMWNADADEGANAWGLSEDIKARGNPVILV
ncbi:hypothetical protein PInf_019494 [Phytophthora infestans]|nr:hypothetical protein PInf_019494 [Phytophthora infestans]